MPVYEYVCQDCDDRFDTLVRNLDAADAVTCSGCESTNVRRLISAFAVSGRDDPLTVSPTASGGCCGGSCGCGG